MRLAGCAKAARRLLASLLIAAGPAWWQGVAAQTPEAAQWYAQGVQALAEGRYAQARAALLEAVEADPGFAGAWLDLALAAYGAGDVVQAEEFLRILEDRFTLPPGVAANVTALRDRIQADAGPGEPARWHWSGLAQAGGGYDSNANAGLAARDLTLTFPSGDVRLPIADALRPRADAYLHASLGVDGIRPLGNRQLEASASARVRRNAEARDFDTVEMQAGLGWGSREPAFGGAWAEWLPGPWRLGAAVQQSRLGPHVLFNSFNLSAMHGWQHWRCAPQASLEADWRTFPQARNLDSRLLRVGVSASCPSSWLTPEGAWGMQARLGLESARVPFDASRGRPGGDTHHAEFTLSRHWAWSGARGKHRVDTLLQWAGAHDTEGYSPLLNANDRRRVHRLAAGAAYTVPMADDWAATLTWQAFRQRSNLEPFRLSGQILQLSIQRNW